LVAVDARAGSWPQRLLTTEPHAGAGVVAGSAAANVFAGNGIEARYFGTVPVFIGIAATVAWRLETRVETGIGDAVSVLIGYIAKDSPMNAAVTRWESATTILVGGTAGVTTETLVQATRVRAVAIFVRDAADLLPCAGVVTARTARLLSGDWIKTAPLVGRIAARAIACKA
jgi:hypothetical protein